MEHIGLLLIFWYGVLHAFGADHLTAIADFSIGKDKAKTMLITILFAIGHGVSLFVFAKILQSTNMQADILEYGDIISATIIFGMGLYLLYMVFSDKVQIKKHIHEDGKEHIHVWFGPSHTHDDNIQKSSSFTMGLLMGAGGVRGMLITLSAVGSGDVSLLMIAFFTAGVMLIFVLFGLSLSYFNNNFLNNKTNLRRAFTLAGSVSLIVGANILIH